MVNVLASRAVKYAYLELVPGFEAACGIKVVTPWSSTGAIVEQVASDAPFDLAIASAGRIAGFIAGGTVLAGSRVDPMQSEIGIAVKAGAPWPDIGSGEAVKRALLAAKSIGYSLGPSGMYLQALFAKMGIANEMQAKATQSTPGISVAHYVATGAVELGFQQIGELIDEPGIAFLGPLPRALAAKEARALQAFLAAPAAGAVVRKNGLEQARP